MFTLNSNRLQCVFFEPEDLINQHRFDHTAFIADVALDGQYTFCAIEPHTLRERSSEGRGLCSEIQDHSSEEAKALDFFPKFGVGLIRKPDERPFLHFRKYKDVLPFITRVTHTDNMALLMTKPVECMGYALQTMRSFTVAENTLTEEVTFTNEGQKDLSLREYCHNFLSLDGMALGTDYELSLPGVKGIASGTLMDAAGRETNYEGYGESGDNNDLRGLRVKGYQKAPSYIYFPKECFEATDGPSFTLKYAETGLSVSEYDDFLPDGAAIWSCDHMLSPEIFAAIALKPGESLTLHRKWVFEPGDGKNYGFTE